MLYHTHLKKVTILEFKKTITFTLIPIILILAVIL